MTETYLPWTFFGRKLKPFSLALSVSTGIVAFSALRGALTGVGVDGIEGWVTGIAGIIAVVLLVLGWLVQGERLMREGLLVATGAWAALAAHVSIEIGWFAVSAMLAWTWVIAAGGAWLLEISYVEKSPRRGN